MTTREAIAIVRDEAKYHGPIIREALLLVASACEHYHARRTIRKKARKSHLPAGAGSRRPSSPDTSLKGHRAAAFSPLHIQEDA